MVWFDLEILIFMCYKGYMAFKGSNIRYRCALDYEYDLFGNLIVLIYTDVDNI